MYYKTVNLIQEIGTIMYVGGILSHIAISIILGHPDAFTAYNVALYKEVSAYVLIIPGLCLKIISDLILYFHLNVKENWLKLKFVMIAFLSINAFVFLVPMMPELTELAKASIPDGQVSQSFLEKESFEKIVGMSNIIPLILEILLGSLKPKLFGERKPLN